MTEETLLDTAESEEVTAEQGEIWHLAEDVTGTGDAPDWFKSEKYKTVADQAKAYAGLESKLGSFTGAPEDGYQVELPEGFEGYTVPDDDPMMNAFNETAQELGISQEGYTKLFQLYVNGVMQADQSSRDQELQNIGPDATQRITDMVKWGKANLDENEFNTLQGLATTADGFSLLEKMRSMSRETQVTAPDQTSTVSVMTEQKLQELMADPRYYESPTYRSEVEQKFREFYGNAPANRIMQ